MNVSTNSLSGEPEVMAEMNTTPLIDVMLVLLIMFIITIPVQLHSVDMNMPTGNPPPPAVQPEVVRIDIDADGTVHWNGDALANPHTDLEAHLASAAAQSTQPELHVRPDKRAPYRDVAAVLASVQRNGLTKIGIVGGEQFI
jgi:biopolymer transport protein ExbD